MGKECLKPENRFVEDVNFVRKAGLLDIFLKDRTTGQNIIWASGGKDEEEEIKVEDVVKCIKPRWLKNKEDRKQRTRSNAEVFTPSGICREMVKTLRAKGFNSEKNLLTSICLEITCGEAPFVASRYDMETGESIAVEDRFGLLDEKLKCAGEKENTFEAYRDLALRALSSVYGYEFQGDSLFMARINVFMDFVEHWKKGWKSNPDYEILKHAAEVISWNFWQMDGLSRDFLPPLKTAKKPCTAIPGMEFNRGKCSLPCRIRFWDSGEEVEFRELFKGNSAEKRVMKEKSSSCLPLFPLE